MGQKVRKLRKGEGVGRQRVEAKEQVGNKGWRGIYIRPGGWSQAEKRA